MPRSANVCPRNRVRYTLYTNARVDVDNPLRHRWEATDRHTSLRSDERSTSPKSVVHIPGIGDPLQRNTHLRELEGENAKLKRMYADLALENAAIKDVLARKL